MPQVEIQDGVYVTDSKDSNAIGQFDSTDKYFLPPRMTTTQRDAITPVTDGAEIFNTTTNQLEEYKSSAWGAVGGSGGSAVGGSANSTYTLTTGATTTSTSYSDVSSGNTEVTATMTGGGKAIVTCYVMANKQTANHGFLRITDGTNNSNEYRVDFNSGGGREIAMTHIFDTTAGSTTYELQFRSSDSNIFNVFSTQIINMSVQEIL